MKKIYKKTFLLLFIFSLVILASINVISYKTINRLEDAMPLVTRSYQAIRELAEIEIALVYAESTQRIYLITGEKKYFILYQAERNAPAEYFQTVKVLIKYNPLQQQRFDTIKKLIRQCIQRLVQSMI